MARSLYLLWVIAGAKADSIKPKNLGMEGESTQKTWGWGKKVKRKVRDGCLTIL